MRTAHLIITYTDPKQTERMILSMTHPDFDFYIHVDKKNDILPHLYLGQLPNVYFIHKRIDVRWAGFNTIKAIFNCINEICNNNNNKQYGFINILSGQDYPLKPVDELARFFTENRGKEFIAYNDMLTEWQDNQWRYKKVHLNNVRWFTRKPLRWKRIVEKGLNYILGERKMPYGFHPYGKSMFWILSPEVALYVTKMVENDRRLRRFFYFTWASDEMVFQTIVMNSPYKNKVVNENYRYIKWLSEDEVHPEILGEKDFENIKESSMLFARKFDMNRDRKVLDKIDEELLRA